MTLGIRYSFEVPYAQVEEDIDAFIDAVFHTLQSAFLLLPRGPGFIVYPDFQQAYEVLKRHTAGFVLFTLENAMSALQEDALAFVVLRTILGFTPPELAYVASQESGLAISQNFARSLDRRVRSERQAFCSLTPQTRERLTALVSAACKLIREGPGKAPEDMIHRLDKAATRSGLTSLRHLASEGAPVKSSSSCKKGSVSQAASLLSRCWT